MTTLCPYLNFNGNTREAMTFYQACFGGELTFQTIAEAPFADKMPPEMQDGILHSMLKSDAVTIMGSDMVQHGLVAGNNVSLMLGCDSEAQINSLYEKLSAGGTIRDALKEQFWGDIFGAITDRFGIQWALNCPKAG